MAQLELDQLVLRYCRQVIMETMDHVRSTMRGANIASMKHRADNPTIRKSEENPTKTMDLEAEDLIVGSLQQKFARFPEIGVYTVFSEELGMRTFPAGASEAEAKLVVFVDGCFWHGHDCGKNVSPKTNAKAWREKIERNKTRDRKVGRALRAEGWSVVRVWECELRKAPDKVMRRIARALVRAGM